MDTMSDPEFLKDAEQQKVEVNPVPAERLEKSYHRKSTAFPEASCSAPKNFRIPQVRSLNSQRSYSKLQQGTVQWSLLPI